MLKDSMFKALKQIKKDSRSCEFSRKVATSALENYRCEMMNDVDVIMKIKTSHKRNKKR